MPDETKTLRVLIVEDNPQDVDIVRALLGGPGPPRYEVESLDRVSLAIERLARGDVGAVVLDLSLPDARGLEAVVRLCAAAPQVPVVVLTGMLDEAKGVEALQHGAQEYLVKGAVDARSLRRALRYSIERKQAEDALRRSQKLESLGILAGGVAHDFNNMLSTILGHASLALRKVDPADPTRIHLDRIVRATERAADLTRQMLAYSGRGHFQVTATRLDDLVRENVHLLRASVPKSVELVADLDDTAPAIEADVGQVQQVLMNLVLNGADALEGRAGTVALGTRAVALTAERARTWPGWSGPLAPGRYVELQVRDDGCGMDSATVSRIFDPFFTTKAAGRGLGLAAALGIVHGHGGAIRVDSAPGCGTVFTILFPASARPHEQPLPPAPAAERLPPKGLILVIDDEEELRHTAGELLAAHGFQTITAPDGQAGVAVYAERGSEIDLVILDLSMPGWTGAQTFRELKRLDPGARVILSSGYSDEEASKDFVRRELAGFLRKPYGIDDIGREVHRCLAGARPT